MADADWVIVPSIWFENAPLVIQEAFHHKRPVISSGIGGMESAIKLGDMGYKVLLVEKEASVGGKMILLSKVFPTLDCASCISTPKMGATIHHPNIDVMTYAEVEAIRGGDVVGASFVIELPDLAGRKRIEQMGVPVRATTPTEP